MTNREWLESLSDEDWADFIEQHLTCNNCPLQWKCDYTDTPCAKLYVDWLKAERSENESAFN